jgi:O-antigen/teichoic acid export membrane protein
MISTLPINAIITIFNPIIVELVQSKSFDRLNGLLKLVTKWLLLFNLPLLMLFYILPDVVLAFFDDAYAPSQHPLIILVAGQLIWSACSIAMRIIPMSGYAMLNLANGVVAALVNLGLNYWLIPEYGNIGAAMATSITLVVWSMWRLIEVKWLLNCFPFHKINLLLLGGAVVLSTVLKFVIQDSELWIRILCTSTLIIGFMGLAFWLGRESEDDDILKAIQRKIQRLIGK